MYHSRVTILHLVRALLLFAAISSAACKKSQPERPESLPQRWAKIVAWAEPTVPPAESATLEPALAAAREHAAWIDEHWMDKDTTDGSELALPGELDQAVDTLIAWYRERGGLPLAPCEDLQRVMEHNVLDAMTLARAALLRAGSSTGDAAVTAALYLGHRYREEGKNMLHVAVGSAIARAAADFVDERDAPASEAFVTYQPGEHTVRRALAVEARCQDGMVEVFRADPSLMRENPVTRLMPDVVVTREWMDREIATLRGYNEETVYAASRMARDPDQLEAYLEGRYEYLRAREEWVLASAFVGPWQRGIRGIADDYERYQDFLARRGP